MASLSVRTGDGTYVQVGQFYDGEWYARTPKGFPFSHAYLVRSWNKGEVLEFIAALFDGIESID